MTEIKKTAEGFIHDINTTLFLDSSRIEENTGEKQDVNTRGLDSKQLIVTALTAGLYPQIARILRPPKKYDDVLAKRCEKSSCIYYDQTGYTNRTCRREQGI